MSTEIDSSITPEDAVTCPDCGAEFDIADRLRSHIELNVRKEIKQHYEDKYDNDLAVHNAELENQRNQLNDLRQTKIDYDNLKSEQEVAINEAKAQGARDYQEEMASELSTLRQTKIDHDNLVLAQEIAIKEAKAQGAREATKLVNQELEEKISVRVKEENASKDLEIGRLELEKERQNEIIKRLQDQSKVWRVRRRSS